MNMAVLLQYILPKQAITSLAGKLAHCQGGNLTTSIITWFVKRYQVNMSEAANPDISSYKTFNELVDGSMDNKSSRIRDASIQRFEYTVDTCWKALKIILLEK